ncbi:MAG TPA: hypothetical protein VMN36_10985 [Verrucomicrobiales bacterium]|nr:hypothetical protein [Verrucomicrobiales bacterium]
MQSHPTARGAALIALALFPLAAIHAESLDTLSEFGNAASAPAPNPAGNSHGADFTNAASGEYVITAGGTDFWGNTDNGSYIFDSTTSRPAGEDFSAVVRSVSVAADPLEVLAGEWGRTGIMARNNPTDGASANVAHIRKSGGDPAGTNPADTLIQGRSSNGAGTDRGPGENGEFRNFSANTANGSVRNTPIWLGLHRFGGEWYAAWAPDNEGTPGNWSPAIHRAGTPHLAGEVWIGLAHQSHGGDNAHASGGNTAVFDGLSVTAFDPDLGEFPLNYTSELSLVGTDVFLTASGTEIGGDTPQDVNWQVDYLSELEAIQGILRADIYLQTNAGNLDAFNTMVAGPPAGTTVIETIRWAANNYVQTNAAGVNLFAEAVPGAFGGDQNDYGVHLTGEIHIPSDAARGGVEEIYFHDGVDDFCVLEIDGVLLINDNTWSNLAGNGNGGGAQAVFDCSDPKFDDGEWVSFRMGTWEGGGGDDAILVWNALDTTGSDEVTGGTDAVLDSYLGASLGTGAQISFLHDRSDEIPPENFRALAASVNASESGAGQPVALQLPTPLDPATSELRVYLDGQLVQTVPVVPSIASADFIAFDMASIVLADVGEGGVKDIDESTVQVFRDGMEIFPDINKTGTETTITDTFTPEPYSFYSYQVTGSTTAETGSAPFSLETSMRSFPLLPELRAGLPDPPNATEGWAYMEISAVSVLGADLGANEQGFIDAQTVIRDATEGDILAEAIVPYINHSDPESPGSQGDWCPDLPILSDTAADDNQYVTYARTTITIAEGEEGDYTIRIRGDDGYALRIEGASFTSVAGNSVNVIDPRAPDTVFFPAFTGDSNAFAICNFPAAGDYLCEFFGFEGGGGSFQEVGWARGAFTANSQATTWALLGDSADFVGESKWGALPESIIPALPTTAEDAGWSALIFYGATGGTLQQTMDYLRSADPAAAGFSGFLSELNHSDNGGAAGVFNPSVAFPGDPTPGADTDNIKMIAVARIMAPTDGDYTIQVRSDDGFLLRWVDPADTFHTLNGAGQLHPNDLSEAFFPVGTGDSNTRVSAFLTAGAHDLLFIWWEGGGGAHFEISSAPGVVPNHGPEYELLSSTASETNLWLGADSVIVPMEFQITDVTYDKTFDEFTLTWESEDGESYRIAHSTDLMSFDAGETGIPSQGATTVFGPFPNPLPGEDLVLLRVERLR